MVAQHQKQKEFNMTILDANGNPTTPSLEEIVSQMQNHLGQVINHLKMITPVVENSKLQGQLLQKQILDLVFLQEFIINKMIEKKLIDFDEQEFNEFRNKKIEELKLLQEQMKVAQTQEAIKSQSLDLEE